MVILQGITKVYEILFFDRPAAKFTAVFLKLVKLYQTLPTVCCERYKKALKWLVWGPIVTLYVSYHVNIMFSQS
jgi:hypothetical protein